MNRLTITCITNLFPYIKSNNMALKNESDKKSKTNEIMTKVWDEPLGKTLLIFLGLLGGLAATGLTLKVATFTMNNLKEFIAAAKK